MKKRIKGTILSILFLGVLLIPQTSSASTIEELTALLNSLLAQVQTLQQQIAQQIAQQTGQPTVEESSVFDMNLKYGDNGMDVLNLQKVLNMSEDTQVAASGAGSPGNETEYFGALTKVAVIKYQNKYASEILTPLGLTAGTGYVGSFTRNKLYTKTVLITETVLITPIACTADAKICPDGTVVVRTGPDCEFAPCPDNKTPVITSLGGPTSLNVNQTGTWTIQAYDPEGTYLTYSVDWGDVIYDHTTMEEKSQTTSQSATFSHSYSNSGNYTITFKVTDQQGLSAKSTITVQVGGGVTTCTDSDGGKNYYKKGTVTLGAESKTDSCTYCTGACQPSIPCNVTCGAVVEYYCASDKIKSEIYVCPNGCEEGACIKTCVPNCAGKECGDDGCGGSCGTCLINEECQESQCIFISNCGNNICELGETVENCPEDCEDFLLEWESVGPPGGDRFLLEIDPFNHNRMVVVGHNGIHRSFNRGDEWEAIHIPKITGTTLGIAFNSNKQLVVAGSSGVWLTDNYIAEKVGWRKISQEGVTSPSVVFYNNVLFASLCSFNSCSVYKTSDFESWTKVAGIPMSQAILLFKTDSELFASSYGAGPFKFSRSKFVSISGDLSINAIEGTYLAVDPKNADVLYYGTQEKGLWKTINCGLNWIEITPGGDSHPLIYFITIDPNNSEVVWLGLNDHSGSIEQPLFKPKPYQMENGGLYVSVNAGQNWRKIGGGFSGGFRSVYHPDEIITTNYGKISRYLYRTAGGASSVHSIDVQELIDKKINIEILTNGLNCVYINALRNFEGRLYTAGEMGLLMNTESIGEKWNFQRSADTTLYTWDFLKIPTEEGVYYATGNPAWGQDISMGVWYVPDVECNDFEIDCPAHQQLLSGKGVWRLEYGPFDLINSAQNNIFALTQQNGVLVYDSGNWLEKNEGLRENYKSITSLVFGVEESPSLIGARKTCLFDTSNPTCWWYPTANEEGRVYYYNNLKWHIAEGITSSVSDLARDLENPDMVYAAAADGVYKSINGGINWQKTDLADVIVRVVIVSPKNSNVFAATSKGVYASFDAGQTWTENNDGLLTLINDRMIYVQGDGEKQDRLLVATNGGSVFATNMFASEPAQLVCGNNICEPGETVESCPENCKFALLEKTSYDTQINQVASVLESARGMLNQMKNYLGNL